MGVTRGLNGKSSSIQRDCEKPAQKVLFGYSSQEHKRELEGRYTTKLDHACFRGNG